MADLEIMDLRVSVDGKEILSGVSLYLNRGEIVALMGPNGSGKSTLAQVLAGHPKYTVTSGSISFLGKDLLGLKPHERSRLGLFLSFQHPSEISGVTVSNFLRMAVNAHLEKPLPVKDFLSKLKEKMSLLNISQKMVSRYLNEGFSGGEKKKAEILQMAMLSPKISVLDETDSGVDVDSLKIIGGGITKIAKENTMGVLLITHYNAILKYVKPNRIVIMVNGKIVKTSGPELASIVEKTGFDSFNGKNGNGGM